jgi:hypothetical protein
VVRSSGAPREAAQDDPVGREDAALELLVHHLQQVRLDGSALLFKEHGNRLELGDPVPHHPRVVPHHIAVRLHGDECVADEALIARREQQERIGWSAVAHPGSMSEEVLP